VSKIIRLTESDLTRIVKNVIMQSNKEKSILKEDCVQSMALINPRTGKPAYIDTITGKYCNPYDRKGFNGMPIDYDPITKTELLQAWVRSYPCVVYDKRFKRVNVTPTESRGPIAFDFNNKGNLWRYFDNGIKQFVGEEYNDGSGIKDSEITIRGGKFSCNDEEFKFVDQACKTKSQTALSKAVNFWKNWLNNPITKEKVYKNYLVRSKPELINNVDKAFKKYFNILNNLNLIFYDQTTPDEELDSYAYVIPGESLYDIHINCSKDIETLLDTLVHEIQHLIYHVKPLNPAKKISNAFVGKNKKPETMSNVFNFDKLEIPNIKTPLSLSTHMEKTAKKLNIYDSYLSSLKFYSDEEENADPGYVCRETEKMSNIMSMRLLFSIQPGGRITSNMLIPYITTKKYNTNVDWFLLCWAQRGFPDIDGMLDHINKLALNQDDEKPKIGDLPKPNFS